MKTPHILLCLALSLLGAGLKAQNDLPQVFSPNAAELGKYGKIPVSYFNGLPNISIPLTELHAKGYTLPIYLTYHAGGNKPDQHPGWVGMGWTLHAGGCINRIVNGLKDEMSLYEFNNVYHGNPHCNPGYLHHASDTQDEINWDNDSELEEEMAVIVSSAQYSPVIRRSLDREPDEFQVNIEDIHASFYFVSAQNIKIVSKDESDFTVSYTVKPGGNGSTTIELFHADIGFTPIRVSTFDYIDSFVITNHDGTKYYFGQDESAIEFSVSPNINQQGASSGFSGTATANSWMLTRIERPDGESVVFQYVKDGTPIICEDSHWRRDFRTTPDFARRFDLPLRDSIDTRNQTQASINANGHMSINYYFVTPCYLQSITCGNSGDWIRFSIEETTELPYEIDEDEFEKRTNGQLLEPAMVSQNHYMQLAQIETPHGNIDFSYTQSKTTRLKLREVSFLKVPDYAGKYEMYYNTTSLPAQYNSRMSDLWGYYLGTTYPLNDTLIMGHRSLVNAAALQAEILTKLVYPTEGYTVFEYEPHDYSHVVEQHPIRFIARQGSAGGLRIKRMKDYTSADAKPVERRFYYGDTVSSGILSGRPKCVDKGDFEGCLKFKLSDSYSETIDYTYYYEMFSERSYNQISLTDGNHVTYSSVTEVIPGKGRTVYHYSNHDTPSCLDVDPVRTWYDEESDFITTPLISRALSRGLLLRKEEYDEEGVLKRRDVREYAQDTTRYIKTLPKRSFAGSYIMQIAYLKEYSYHPYLQKRVVTDYPDEGSPYSITTEYTYDLHRRLTEVTRNVAGTIERDNYTYTGIYNNEPYTGMKLRNMITYPVEHIRFRKDTLASEKVIAAELITWKKDNGFYVPSEQWKADFGGGIAGLSFNQFNGSSKDSHYGSAPELSFSEYDSNANLILSEDRSCMPTTYFWTSDKCHPSAVFAGAKNGTRTDSYLEEVTDIESADLYGLYYESSIDIPFNVAYAGTVNVYLNFLRQYGRTVWWRMDGGTEHQWVWPNLGPDEELEVQTLFSAVLPAGNHLFQITAVQGNYTEEEEDQEEEGESGDETICGIPLRSSVSWGTIEVQYPAYEDVQSEVRADECLFEDFESNTSSIHDGFYSGRSYYGVKVLDFVPNSEKTYIIDWQELQSDGTWVYNSKTASPSDTFSAGTAGKYIDHVRVFPVGTTVESYTWDTIGNQLSHTDSRGVTERYRYDLFGRLIGVYDNEGRKVEGYQYNYQNR